MYLLQFADDVAPSVGVHLVVIVRVPDAELMDAWSYTDLVIAEALSQQELISDLRSASVVPVARGVHGYALISIHVLPGVTRNDLLASLKTALGPIDRTPVEESTQDHWVNAYFALLELLPVADRQNYVSNYADLIDEQVSP